MAASTLARLLGLPPLSDDLGRSFVVFEVGGADEVREPFRSFPVRHSCRRLWLGCAQQVADRLGEGRLDVPIVHREKQCHPPILQARDGVGHACRVEQHGGQPVLIFTDDGSGLVERESVTHGTTVGEWRLPRLRTAHGYLMPQFSSRPSAPALSEQRPVTDDGVHSLGDLIEHVQTRWEGDRDTYIEPLADFTARALIAAGYRLPAEPQLQYGVRSIVNRAIFRAGTEESAREAATKFPEKWVLVARTTGAFPGPWADVAASAGPHGSAAV